MRQQSKHRLSPADQNFVSRFEACLVPPSEFHHREHIALAYIYLTQDTARDAHLGFRSALKAFIRHNGIDESKYHETITYAWILAVDHFMQLSPPSGSSEEFIRMNPRLLKSEIMLSHYSKKVLFSQRARERFVEPDLEPIPTYI